MDMPFLGIIVALIVIGVLIWAAQRILAVTPIAEPFRTVIYVLLVLMAVFILLDMFGLLGGTGFASFGHWRGTGCP
jgi:predicted membrane channel-forming protein YqfA (hemolysin III family)